MWCARKHAKSAFFFAFLPPRFGVSALCLLRALQSGLDVSHLVYLVGAV